MNDPERLDAVIESLLDQAKHIRTGVKMFLTGRPAEDEQGEKRDESGRTDGDSPDGGS
jgi:hypothetical protein